MGLYIAFACIILALWVIWRRKHLSTFKKLGIPGPEPNLLFGNILELYTKGAIQCHNEWVAKYGRVLGYFYGMKPVLLVTDPQLLKNIFIKDFSKFINREAFSPLLVYDPNNKHHQSILILPGKKWKDVRSILTPTFTAAKMKQMASSMNASMETMLDVMKANAEKGKVFDVFDTYQRVTMDVICKTAFGVHADVQTNPKSGIITIVRHLFSTSFRDPLTFVGLCLPLLKKQCFHAQEIILGIINGFKKPNVLLRNGIISVLGHRRKNPQGAKCDLLQLMIDSKIQKNIEEVDTKSLEAGNSEIEAKEGAKEEDGSTPVRRMTDDEIISSSFTVLLAGYETTSTALAFTTYLIAKHQDVQQRLYEEIHSIIEDGQAFDYSTIGKLQYLDKVFNESMRVYPPVTFFTNRYAMEDVEYGDLKIPKGTLINVPVYVMHHDPEFWENPEKFDPDRFNDKVNTNGIIYLPFGVGPRNCLGMRFAQLEAKLVLAHVINKFKITLEDSQEDLELYLKIRTVVPKGGVRVKMELRQEE